MKKHATIFLTFLLAIAQPALAGDESGFTDNFTKIDPARWYVSNGWSNGDHQSCEWRADAWSANGHGLTMTISDKGGAQRPIGCPEMHSKAKLSYGRYETRMKIAAGSGLNTAFFTYIGPGVKFPEWDEIDFEFLGKDPTHVELNYIAKDQKIKGKYYGLGFDASKDFHDYAFEWHKTAIFWFVDGKEVLHTPTGAPIPRNPAMLYIDLWTGGPIEDAWMGKFTYTQPLTAEVASVKYTPFAE